MFGLCVTPNFLPTNSEANELNYPYQRSILYEVEDINKLLVTEKPFIITLNNQCREVGGDWSGWDNTVFILLEGLKLKGKLDQLKWLVAGNEFDIYWERDGSVPPEFGADLAIRTARLAHNYGVKVSATSVAGRLWQDYLQSMSDICRNQVDAFDVHFYGQRPDGWRDGEQWFHGNLSDALNTALNITQKGLIATEIGVKIQDAGNEEEVANWLTAAHDTLDKYNVRAKCWFAFKDQIGAPSERGGEAFGLLSDQDRKRPAWFSFMQTNSGVATVPTRNFDKWKNKVGEGLLEMMQEDNTEPAQRVSTWLPLGVTPSDIEECYGINGTKYYWLLGTDQGFRQTAS